jgi:hypothetical protein
MEGARLRTLIRYASAMTPVDATRWALEYGAAMPDTLSRRCFRCSARLLDGTYLPCLVLREAAAEVEMVLSGWRASRLAEPPSSDEVYESNFKAIAVGGSRVSLEQIRELETSPYAISWDLLQTLPGEVDWHLLTFTGVMDDGARFLFHTSMTVAFFEMPEGYSAQRVRQVIPAAGGIEHAYREREGVFAAFVEGVDFGPMPTRCRMGPA